MSMHMYPNREYKSRIFSMVFSQKKELLELYNAMNGTNYDNPDLLEINTLDNAIYLAMKNDVSFLIDSRMSLYEHQSTFCPNIPLRFLQYVADLYSSITKDENLYGTKLIPLPTPEFIVFYNGTQKAPDFQELYLSTAYQKREPEPALELKVRMLNINKGHNLKLMDACRTLRDYAEYTDRVRQHAETMPTEEAVEHAITECINEGILSEFLSKNRAEAKKVSIYEYDEEKHMRQEREQHFAEGRIAGRQEAVLELLGELGTVPEELREKITSEDNADTLRFWLKLAADSDSVNGFMQKAAL